MVLKYSAIQARLLFIRARSQFFNRSLVIEVVIELVLISNVSKKLIYGVFSQFGGGGGGVLEFFYWGGVFMLTLMIPGQFGPTRRLLFCLTSLCFT